MVKAQPRVQQPWMRPGQRRNGLILLGIWAAGALLDRTWYGLDHSVPAWDDASYLVGALNYWQALKSPHWLDRDWWVSLWLLSSKIPPLVYLVTALILQVGGTALATATLVHLFYSAVLLVSVYGLGASLFGTQVGLWAAGLVMILPGLYPWRLHFLLDHPVIAMVTLSFWMLTLWWQLLNRQSTGRVGDRSIAEGRPPTVGDQSAPTIAAPNSAAPNSQPVSRLSFSDRLLTAPQTASQILQAAVLGPQARTVTWAPPLLKDQPQTNRPPVRSVAVGHRVGIGGPSWFAALGFGLTLGLALLTKQTTILFLLVPLLWAGLLLLWQRRPLALLQWLLGIGVATAIAYPWYRTNWLLILTSSQRATVVAAIAEGDPPLNTLAAWTYYGQLFPEMLSYPLLILAGLGFGIYGRRLGRPEEPKVPARNRDLACDPSSPITADLIPVKTRRQLAWQQWWRSGRWLLVFVVGAYLLSSLNVNKDDRYITPMLPILAILMAQGLTLLPQPEWRWSGVGLTVLMMLTTLFPLLPGWESDATTRFAIRQAGNWHHADVVETILKAEPYQRHTVGVLPSVPEFNQHNISYFGNLRNFQVHGRQVGAADREVWQDSRSLSWYLVKTGYQGAIRQPQALKALTETVTDSAELKLQSLWELPDRSSLKLYRRRRPPVQVEPWTGKVDAPVALQSVQVSPVARPGEPLPVKYQWVGNWETLQTGVVVLNWKRVGNAPAELPVVLEGAPAPIESPIKPSNAPPAARWLHDHGIGLGLLAGTVDPKAPFQVTERLAMLPPDSAAGVYSLEAVYLNRKTGDSYDLTVPTVQVIIDAKAKPIESRELDPLTQFRLLSGQMPQGLTAMDKVFEQVARLNLYDPTQDYLEQAQAALTYRLQQEPQNVGFAYGLALSQALQRHVEQAIAEMGRVAALDPKNPNVYAYLGVVNLYDWRAGAARSALESGLALKPDSRELQGLLGIADLMQGNVVKAVQAVQQFQATAPQSPKSPKSPK